PVSSRTTKLHRAISPSMKDQWSGKTLRICFLAMVARPRRSSAHSAAAPTRLGFGAAAALVPLVVNGVFISASPSFPVARADWFGEVTLGRQVALAVHHDGQLGQGTGGGAEDHLAIVRQVERRLVARAEQVVGLLLPQGDRAADVGADLREAEDAVDAPVRAPPAWCDVVGVH